MPPASPPQATKTSRAFRLEYAVSIDVRAKPEQIAALLTNAGDFPRWNSTVSKITGAIAEGETIAVQVPSAPGRTFKLKVAKLEPARSMVWSAGFAPMFKAVRTFTLTPKPDGTTAFSMIEVMTGAMLPMIKVSLPDFAPVFATYAADLKREAERAV